MFLPIGSNIPVSRPPYVTLAWMGLCLLTFIFITQADLSLLREIPSMEFSQTLTYHFAIVPASSNALWKFISYQFVHASWGHLISNMWYFIIFGWILENSIGSSRFLLFSLIGGAVAVLPEFFVQSQQALPIVGASGSVAFVMGACALMYPKAKIRLLFLLIPLPNTPASFFMPLRFLVYFWLVLQISGLAMNTWVDPRPVAYATHLFGFALGAVLGLAGLLSGKSSKMVDVDLSGKELRKFYKSLAEYQSQKFESANQAIRDLSDSHPWVMSLQFQLFAMSVRYHQKALSDHIFKNLSKPLLGLKKKQLLNETLGLYYAEFGSLPKLSVEEIVQVESLLEGEDELEQFRDHLKVHLGSS